MVVLYARESRKVAACLLQGTIQGNDYEIPYFILDNSYLEVDGRLALPTSTLFPASIATIIDASFGQRDFGHDERLWGQWRYFANWVIRYGIGRTRQGNFPLQYL